MNIISGAQFKDCTPSDFEHYFSKTILLWNLSPTKKRLFVCEMLSGGTEVRGTYLTRQRELKEKWFPFLNWWQHLDVLPPYGKTFSLGNSAAGWYPSMAKNLKKSYPAIMLDGSLVPAITFYGRPTAAEATVQNVLACAFGQYYSPLSLPSLGEALQMEGSAVATKGEFVINYYGNSLHFRNSLIGKVRGVAQNKEITVASLLAKEILVDIGQVPPEKVLVV